MFDTACCHYLCIDAKTIFLNCKNQCQCVHEIEKQLKSYFITQFILDWYSNVWIQCIYIFLFVRFNITHSYTSYNTTPDIVYPWIIYGSLASIYFSQEVTHIKNHINLKFTIGCLRKIFEKIYFTKQLYVFIIIMSYKT